MSFIVGMPRIKRSVEFSYDPVAGRSQREVWTGTQRAMQSLAATYEQAKVKCLLSFDQGQVTLSTEWTSIQDPAGEVPSDRYEFSNEFTQESIWKSYWLFAAASASAPTADPLTTIAAWRSQCEDSLKSDTNGGPVAPASTGFTGSQLLIYTGLVLSGDTYERDRLVLSRVRTVSQQYANQVLPAALPNIYTTDKLVSTFAIPSDIAARLPSDPSASISGLTAKLYAAGLIWGWRKRRETSIIIKHNSRVEEVMDWVFDMWPIPYYNIVL